MIDFSIYNAKAPEILAVKCPECGNLDYPAPMICRVCGARRDPSGLMAPEWETLALEGACTLLTWTKVYNLPEGFDRPYLLFGIVEFENGLRAVGRLDVNKPETGMSLTAEVEVSDERPGREVNVFVFHAPASRS
jgi:uncharacterized OB-fold protein